MPDYSFCGYRQSEEPIPWIAAKVYVPAMKGDATAFIQKALDYVASLLATQEENDWIIVSCISLEMACIILKANKFSFLSTRCTKGICLMLLEGSI